jgi:HAD superfamily hydrolase (TIGR01484 family)
MQYRALASDYDGTLATHGVVDPDTLRAVARWKKTGRKLLLVTGRELPELKIVFPELDTCDYVVAENGGLLYVPATGEARAIAPAPPPEFVERLIARGVGPISVGHTIVATWQPHENTVLDTIKEMGLELQVIFNKGAVMILPSGVNKATGLAAALKVMELSRHSVAAIGDAENDHAFLNHSRCGVAVSNALPSLKERAEIVTTADHGGGVQELIERILTTELADLRRTVPRHSLPLNADGSLRWFPGEEHLVLQGAAQQAEAITVELAQRLSAAGYQYCRFTCSAPPIQRQTTVVSAAAGEITVGTSDHLATADDVIQNLAAPDEGVRVVLCAHGVEDQSQRFAEILHRVQAFAAERGRPHVIFLPSGAPWSKLDLAALPQGFDSLVVTDDGHAPLTLTAAHQTLPVEQWHSTAAGLVTSP